jgi:hypothetical protein
MGQADGFKFITVEYLKAGPAILKLPPEKPRESFYQITAR